VMMKASDFFGYDICCDLAKANFILLTNKILLDSERYDLYIYLIAPLLHYYFVHSTLQCAY
jgi:hypothetical protein